MGDAESIDVDIVVNNAGIQFRKPLIDFALTDWQRVIDTNLTSAFIVAKEAARRMIARGSGGKIINIGSLTSEAARDRRALHGGEGWHQDAHARNERRMGRA